MILTFYNFTIIIIISSIYVYYHNNRECTTYSGWRMNSAYGSIPRTNTHYMIVYIYTRNTYFIITIIINDLIGSVRIDRDEEKIVPRAQLSRLSYEFYNFPTRACVRVRSCTEWSFLHEMFFNIKKKKDVFENISLT